MACPIENRELCKFLGCDGCESCMVNKLGKKADPVAYADNWDVTLSLLPDDIDELHLSETCKFCKDTPRKKAGYEMVCMKHKEPIHKKGMILGFGPKVDSDVGSLVDLPVAICSSCRRTLAIDKMLNMICILGGMLVGIGIVCIPAISDPLMKISSLLPILVIAAVTFLGYLLVNPFKQLYRKKHDKKIFFNPLEIKQISRMSLLGWKPMQASKSGEVSMNYRKTKLRENLMFKTGNICEKEE